MPAVPSEEWIMQIKPIILPLISVLAASSMYAQQAFKNLKFEQANPVIDLGSIYYPYGVYAASALPGWTAYVGTTQLTDVWQNNYTLGLANVDIFGPNYPAAGFTFGFAPGIIDGNYSVLLQAGGDPNNGTLEAASIMQPGFVPPTAQSLEFKAWTTYSGEFSVSFDGNNLSPVVLGSGANYTLYGVDMSSYAGQIGLLEFSALDTPLGASWLGLDDIMFSPNAIPEPSMVALSAMGGLLFGARKWFARRH
jgi:hypothetical protein